MERLGFLEILVLIVIVGVVALGALNGARNSLSIGANGIVETRCIDGLKYTVGEGGQARQVIGADGAGVKCHD